MKIYLATGNINKKREIEQILSNHTIVIPSDEGIDFNPEETGKTFYENSFIKAKHLYERVHCPVIADDSGLCVDALNGAPGIYSSRYAGKEYPKGKKDGANISQKEKNYLLIEHLNDVLASKKDNLDLKNEQRAAHYTCSIVLFLGNQRFVFAQEIMEGIIVENIKKAAGKGGFGYDPLFFIPELGLTAAELTPEQKNKISHRGKALNILKTVINSLTEQNKS